MATSTLPPPGALEITVVGQGSCRHEPERAFLLLDARATSAKLPAEASAAVTDAVNKVRDMLNPHCPQDPETGRTVVGSPISVWSMTTMSTTANTTYLKVPEGAAPQTQTTYTARCQFNIKFKDFGLLNKLATQFSCMENIRISRVEWNLVDETLEEIRSEGRKLAAKDAMVKARDYAKSLIGAAEDRVRPVTVNESRYYMPTRRYDDYFSHGRGPRGAASTEELQFAPEDVRVEVECSIKFAVEA